MTPITVYLKTPLFTSRATPHVPAATVVIRGQLDERGAGGLTVKVEAFLDDQGRDLDGSEITLLIPFSKIDHAVIE